MTEADERLAAAADRHLSNNPEGQLVQLLLTWIAEDQPEWMTPATQRDIWPTEVRFEWLLSRPDVRGRIVSTLTGISAGAARILDPDVQIALVDAVIDNGDVPVALWAESFDPQELAAHAPPGAVHHHIRTCFPWMAPPDDDRRNFLFAWLEAVMSTGDGNGRSREPIVDALSFRSSIDAEIWQANIPLEMRAAVDDARLAAERNGQMFTAAEEMAVVKLETLIEFLPHSSLHPVIEAAEFALNDDMEGFVALQSEEIEVIEEGEDPSAVEVEAEEGAEGEEGDEAAEGVQAEGAQEANEHGPPTAPFSDADLLPSDEEDEDDVHLHAMHEDDDEGELPAIEITRTENMTDEVERM